MSNYAFDMSMILKCHIRVRQNDDFDTQFLYGSLLQTEMDFTY